MRIKTHNQGGYATDNITTSGGRLTGPLVLIRDPIVNLEAVTKRYCDGAFAHLNANNFVVGTLKKDFLPAFTGDVTKEQSSDVVLLNDTGITPGSYSKVRITTKGRATEGKALLETDLPPLSFNLIGINRPTTLSDYGIIDSIIPDTTNVMTGDLFINSGPTQNNHIVNKEYIDGLVSGYVPMVPGSYVRKSSPVTPNGYLRCNGAAVDKTTYPGLYAVLGDAYSASAQLGSGKPWKQQFGFNSSQSNDITGWAADTSIPAEVFGAQVVVTKKFVYLLGGFGLSGYSAVVYKAPIDDTGAIGAWTTGTALPVPMMFAQAIVIADRVYLIGGQSTNGATLSSIYTCSINSDGTLGSWTLTTPLPSGVYAAQAVITKNRLYVIGGENGGTRSSVVYTAAINNDGTLDSWTTTNFLPTAFSFSRAVITKGRIYLLGGRTSSGQSASVYTAPINSDGIIGAWTIDQPLPSALDGYTAVVTKNTVYLIGKNTSGSKPNVYMASINSDGTLGSWVVGTPIPVNQISMEAVVTSSRIYLLGGNDNGTAISSVYMANFLGGANDYSSYYDSPAISTDPTKFNIPDYTGKEFFGSYTYIKT